MKTIFIMIAAIVAGSASANPSLVIQDPAQLAALEAAGYTFSNLLSGIHTQNNAQLIDDPRYKSVVESILADLRQRESEDPYLSVTMAKKHRLFNGSWLSSKKAHFELVGIINRLDRAPFASNPTYPCGETRFIYRLAYHSKEQGGPIYSRLPMTVNIIYWQVGNDGKFSSDCSKIARNWQQGPVAALVGTAKNRINTKHLKSVEINLQAVRWPSTVRPDFGGYAEYFLRVFELHSGTNKFALAPMENMVDVARVKKSTKLKNELLAYLRRKEVIAAFDQGVGVIPEHFLAKKATSVAFHGLARLANRPIARLFSEQDFSETSFASYQTVKTPAAYLRRLNDMSCVGCHQGRAMAGFHFVGIDLAATHPANSVHMPMSGHMQLDLGRRNAYLTALVAGRKPNAARGFSERVAGERGTYGAHCGLKGDKSFIEWTCESGLTCQSLDTATTDNLVGVCLPLKNRFAGDPCDVGRVSQNADPTRDKVVNKKSRACKEGHACFEAGDGFPGGLCHSYCDDPQKGESCGLIAFNGFNPCLGRGESFVKCLETFTGKLTLKACDEEAPCRDDFVCARTGTSVAGEGACIPPYFLFQLRLDGHPKP